MAGLIPQSFIDELMNRVDIVEVIDGRIPLKKAGHEYKACCPFHGEKTPSFTVSPSKQFYHCFGCGAHGTALGFLMEYEHMEFVEAVEELARQLGLEVPRETGGGPERARESYQDLYALLEQAAAFYQRQLREHPAAGKAVDYLKGRGLSGEIAKTFGIGYAPPGWDSLLNALGGDAARREQVERAGLAIQKDGGGLYDRFRDRIQFPIRDRRGRVIGFGGRVMGDDGPKYLNSPETPVFHKGRELYGLFEARKATRKLERLLVVEGYMDVVALAQFGISYAVATLGTATTAEHLERLFRVVPEVVFCFDGDRAGREAAWRALENALPVLEDGRQARFLFLPDGEDPDSLVRKIGKAGFEDQLAGAMAFSEFFFSALGSDLNLALPEAQASLAVKARPLLEKLPTGLLRQHMARRLEELSHAQPGQFAGLGGKRPPPPPRPRAPAPAGLNPVRKTICLLLNQPSLATQAGDYAGLASSDTPGVDLLIELLDLILEHPQITLGGILEHWRDTEHARHLSRLAQMPLEVPEDGREAEFLDALGWLARQAQMRRREFLEHKLQTEGLSQEEKQEWSQLLSLRHQGSASQPPGNK